MKLNSENYKFLRTVLSLLAAVLFGCNFFIGFQILRFNIIDLQEVFHPFFVDGVLFFIAIITFIQFFLLRDLTYIYYTNYILLNLLYFLLIFCNNHFPAAELLGWSPLLSWRIFIPLLVLSYCFYILFAIYFLDVKNKSAFVHRWITFFLKIYFFLFFLSVLVRFLPLSSSAVLIINNSILLACMPIGLISILMVIFKINNPMAKILAIGSLFFFTGSVLGFIFSVSTEYPINEAPFNNWIFYTQTGALIEIILFTSSFSYRTKFLEKEKLHAQQILLEEMEENQRKEQKLREIRNNIAKDLHDDIGATLSNLNILNELAKRNSENIQSKEYLEKAQEDIQHVSESISDIVWNINPKFDRLDNLFIRMKRYAADMLEAKDIQYSFEFPEDESLSENHFEFRRDIYLIFKEAVNNLVKYSEATKVNLKVSTEINLLKMEISDNGKGFAGEQLAEGNGLTNMKSRAENMNADLQIFSSPGKGTQIYLSVPLSYYPNS